MRPTALLLSLALVLAAGEAQAQSRIRIASWHIDDLWHEAGKALRVAENGSAVTVRSGDDFEALRRQAELLDADVIALQSIGSPQAARRVLPAGSYHLVFSRQLALRYASDNRSLSDPRRRTGYTAIAVRRNRAVRVQRVVDVPELALSGEAIAGAQRTPAGLAVELRIGGEALWLLAVDLNEACAQAEGTGQCPTLDRQVEILGKWVDDKLGEDVSYVIAGSLNRGVGRPGTSGEAESLWGRLDRTAAGSPAEETIVVLAGADGEAVAEPPDAEGETAESGKSKWSPTPWKYLKLEHKERKRKPVVADAEQASTAREVGVGRMSGRAGKSSSEPTAKPPATPWEVVMTAFRTLFATAREQQARERAEQAAAVARARAEAYAAAREAARSAGERDYGVLTEPIPPLPMRKPEAGDLLAGGAPRLAIGARLARFPDGRGRNPCRATEPSTTTGQDPPLDYILLDRRLTEDNGLAGFGVLAAEPLATPGDPVRCPVFVDLVF